MKAREVLFWPGISTEVTEKIKKSPVCLENRLGQHIEPLKSHEIPPLHWAKVGTDILHKNGRNYLITVDYYSKWPELTLLNSMTNTAVITALVSFQKTRASSMAPQDRSTHSPMASEKNSANPEGNVGESGGPVQSPPFKQQYAYKVVILSLAQMLMGRRLRSSFPVTEDMLKPQLHDPEEVLPLLKERQRKQKIHHDRTAKELSLLRDGEVVTVKEGNKWKPATATQTLPSSRS